MVRVLVDGVDDGLDVGERQRAADLARPAQRRWPEDRLLVDAGDAADVGGRAA